MALATYTDLQTAVGTWSFNRTDLPATDIITLGEARLNRDLRLRVMETDGALTGVLGSRTISLPSAYMVPLELYREDSTGRVRIHKGAGPLETTTTRGNPSYWWNEGSNIAFECPLDSAYSYTLRHLARIALSDASPTNWLLTNHPDAYLAAALVEAALWSADNEQAGRWQARYQDCIDAINLREARSREAPLRADLPQRQTFDINRG